MGSLRVHIVLLALLLALPLASVAQPPRSIPRIVVESSNLKTVGFDAASRRLEVEFNQGGIYRYFEVPAEIYMALMKSESKGKFFHAKIRGKFRFERLDKSP